MNFDKSQTPFTPTAHTIKTGLVCKPIPQASKVLQGCPLCVWTFYLYIYIYIYAVSEKVSADINPMASDLVNEQTTIHNQILCPKKFIM